MNYYKYLKIGLSVLLLIVLLLGFSGDFNPLAIFSSRDLVAKVGDEKITKTDLDSLVESELRSMQMNGEVKSEDKREIEKDALKNLVNEKLFGKLVKDLGLEISDDAMIEEIKKSPAFIDQETGLFDSKRFATMLSQIGKTEHEYLQEMKKSLALYSVFFAFNTRDTSSIELRDEMIFNFLNKVRIVDEIAINSNKIPFDEKIHENEMKKYYEEHGDDFKTSEYRKAHYIIINNKNFLHKVKIDQKELDAKVQEAFDALENKEIRDFYNILCDDEQYAKNLKDELKSDKNFLELLKNEDDLRKKLGNSCRVSFLKEKKISDLPEEFRNFVFSLKSEEISEVKKTTFGYNLILIKEIKNIDKKSLTSEIEEKMKIEKSYEMLTKELETIKSDIIKNQNLKIQDIAKKYNLAFQEFDYFDDDGYYKNNLRKSINDDYSISRDLFNKIFKAKMNEIGIEENRGDYFVYSVSEIIPSIKKDFEDVKNDIDEIIKSNFREKKSLELREEIFNDLEKNNSSIEDIEKKYGDVIFVEKNKKIPHPEIAKGYEGNQNAIFNSEVVFSVKDRKYIKIDDRILILKDFESNQVDPMEKAQYLDVIKRNMIHIENREAVESIFQYLRTKYKVTIYEKNLKD
jgi:peptidyl-prolyl cis-trans isomerase D